MAEESLITEEMRACIGVPTAPAVIQVDRTAIQRFCEAIADSNPLWSDEEYAKSHRYGGLVAPPTFLATHYLSGTRPPIPHKLTRGLNGGGEWEFFKPVRLGDVLAVTSKVVELRERTGSLGKMLFIVVEGTWKNQRNELVARFRGTTIHY